MPALTPKQARFAEEYVLDHNGAAAAVRAGYSARSAKQIANELLTKPDLRAAVVAQEALISAEVAMTRQRVVRELLEAIELARGQARPPHALRGRLDVNWPKQPRGGQYSDRLLAKRNGPNGL